MTENVQITLVVVGGIVVLLALALWMFKDRLDIFNFTASKKSVSAKMARHQDTGITISGNIQAGNRNKISTGTPNATVENNLQAGDENQIHAAAKAKLNTNKKNV